MVSLLSCRRPLQKPGGDPTDQRPDSRCRENLFNGSIEKHGDLGGEFLIILPQETIEWNPRKREHRIGGIGHIEGFASEMFSGLFEAVQIISVALQQRFQGQ